MYAPWLKYFNINAVTVWKWVLYVDKNPSDVLINHERIHLDQIKRDGVFTFYFRYLRYYLILRVEGLPHFLAYKNIPYEQEAYKHEHNLAYKVPDKVMWFG